MATYEYTTQDVEYLRHGDRKFMARLFKPQGKGPFPAVVELHGGAWCNGDLNECQIYAEGFARAGLAVASIDFLITPAVPPSSGLLYHWNTGSTASTTMANAAGHYLVEVVAGCDTVTAQAEVRSSGRITNRLTRRASTAAKASASAVTTASMATS